MSLGETEFVYSNKHLLFNKKPRNPTQKYPRNIEYACIL